MLITHELNTDLEEIPVNRNLARENMIEIRDTILQWTVHRQRRQQSSRKMNTESIRRHNLISFSL